MHSASHPNQDYIKKLKEVRQGMEEGRKEDGTGAPRFPEQPWRTH